MKRICKTTLCLVLCLALLLAFALTGCKQENAAEEPEIEITSTTAPVQPGKIIDQGSCGEHLSWKLDENGLLIIEGSGDMDSSYLIVAGGEGVDNRPLFWNGHGKEIKAVVLPDGLKSISQHAFADCTALESVILPEGIEAIGAHAFRGCTALTCIVIPDSVTRVEGAEFYGCSALTSVKLGKGLDSISPYMFRECSSLKHVILPEGIKAIGFAAFWGCTALTSVTLPDSVTDVSQGAFASCIALTKLEIGKAASFISPYAFANLPALSAIHVDADNPAFAAQDGVLFDKDQKTLIQYPAGKQDASYEIPDGVTSIEEGAFSHCNALCDITIPASVLEIGNKTMNELKIPTGMKSISDSAFVGCDSLVLRVTRDSYAESYAKEYNLPFEWK